MLGRSDAGGTKVSPAHNARCASGSPSALCGRTSAALVSATAWLVREIPGPPAVWRSEAADDALSKLIRSTLAVLATDTKLTIKYLRKIVRDSVVQVSVSERDYEAAVAVRRATLSIGRRLKAQRPAEGRPSLELSVLGHLHRRGPMTPGELAAAERVQPQTLTRTLTSLERGGLIARAAHPQDGRRAMLTLTEAGLDALRSDMAVRDDWLAAVMASRLTGTERELLRLAATLLERLADEPGPPPEHGRWPPTA